MASADGMSRMRGRRGRMSLRERRASWGWGGGKVRGSLSLLVFLAHLIVKDDKVLR